MNETLTLIPARGGSKSIPRKNIMLINGKPMLAWTIMAALESKLIDRVIVSTDDQEIADVALSYGAEVPFLRPNDISGDLSTDIEFHKHALSWLKTEEGYEPDQVVNLRPTTPYRSSEVIDKAISTFSKNPDADSLRSVHMATESPFKMWFIDESRLKPVMENLDHNECYNQPRQLLPNVYWQDGYIDITRPRVIFDQNSTTGKYIIPFLIEEQSIDIDYMDTFDLAEKQLKEKTSKTAITEGERNLRHPS